MIKLYERLIRHCKTINQINRVHIALENWMTPLEWQQLSVDLLADDKYDFLHKPSPPSSLLTNDIKYVQHKWFQSLRDMYSKANQSTAQPFHRHHIRRHIRYFKTQDTPVKKTLVVCFTGVAQRMMVPLAAFMQHFDAEKTDIVLINYPKGKGFRGGLEGTADSFENTIDTFEKILPINGYSKVVTIGVSGGGLPAILCALKLGWDAALSFSGGNPEDTRWKDVLGYSLVQLIEKFSDKYTKKMPLFLVYGADSEVDMQAAKSLAKLLPCTQIKVEAKNKPVGHVSLYPILNSGKLSTFLKDTVLKPSNIENLSNTSFKLVNNDTNNPLYKSSLTQLTGPKYFCIGFNKTGTTSMGRSFEILGLTPVAEPRSPYVDFKYLSKALFEQQNYQPALDAAIYFKSFQDRPWNVWDIYKHLDKRFEGSYFILTERDSDSWWNSVEKWLKVANKYDRLKYLRYLHHLKVEHLDKDSFIKSYENYNQEVKEYFKSRDNFLIMNLSAGDGWDKLCQFLHLPKPDVPFPHANMQSTYINS